MLRSKCLQNLVFGRSGCGWMIFYFAVVSGCMAPQTGTPMPGDTFHYPTGAAIFADQNLMAVTSSNFDLRYQTGQLHLIDLAQVNEQLNSESPAIPLEENTLGALEITSFGSGPVILSAEENIIGWVHRDQTGAFGAQINLENDSSQIQCLGNFDTFCGPMKTLETMGAHPARPFTDGEQFWIPHLSEGQLTIFSQKDPTTWQHQTTLDLSEHLNNIRTGTFSSSAQNQKRIWLGGDYLPPNSSTRQTRLIWFQSPQNDATTVTIEGSLDLTQITGSTVINDLAWMQQEEILVMALRNPDGVALFDVAQKALQTPQIALRHLTGACDDPTRVLPFLLNEQNYFALSCFDDNAVWIYRESDLAPVALRENDGKGPLDLLWDEENKKLWVSYFKSHFIGAYEISAETTSVEMTLVGQLGNSLILLEQTP